jgi:hypothetical protein
MTRASDIWPHLAGRSPAPSEPPRTRNALAESLYPNLAAPKKPTPKLAIDKIGRTEATRYGAGMIKQTVRR